MKRISVVLAALVIAIPSAAQAQNYGYCYSLGKDSAGQKEVIYTGVFPWADNSAAGSASSTEAREQMRRAFRASLDEARLHAGSSSQMCTTRGRQEPTIQAMQEAKKYHEEVDGYKITPFTFTPPADLAFSGPTEEATLRTRSAAAAGGTARSAPAAGGTSRSAPPATGGTARSARANQWAWCNSLGKWDNDNAAVYTETFSVPASVVEARIRVQFIRYLDANMPNFRHESTRCFFPYETAGRASTALLEAKGRSRSRGIRIFGSYRSFTYVDDR